MSRNDQHTMANTSNQPDFSSITSSAEEEPFFVEIDKSPPPAAESNNDSAPAWFRGGSQKSRPTASPPPAPSQRPPAARSKPAKNSAKRRSQIVPEDEAPEEDLTWQEKAKRWITGEGGAGYGISVLVHIVLLLIMSLWIFSQPKEEELVTTVTEASDDVAAFQDVDMDVDLIPDLEEQVNNPLLEPAPLSAPDLGINLAATTATESKGGGVKFQMPARVFTKGSFTVWTEPNDPKPGERYNIIVEIKLDKNVKRYPLRDLSGFVVGTDGYKQNFGGPTEAGYVDVKNNRARLQATTVPGASQLVKDVITVKSKILEEKQEIEIIF